MSLREQILMADDLKRKPVTVPSWGEVWVRTLTAGEQERVSRWADEQVPDFAAKVAALCLVDDTGKNLFTEADVPALSKKSGNCLSVVFDAYKTLNAITDDVIEEKKSN